MLQAIGTFKPDSRLDEFLLACEADARGRTGFENRSYPQSGYIREAASEAAAVDTSSVFHGDLQGPQIGDAIRQLRIAAVNSFKQRYLSIQEPIPA
jgi:tRNA nucleotidyltransferase (CCA-adding enzyme)